MFACVESDTAHGCYEGPEEIFIVVIFARITDGPFVDDVRHAQNGKDLVLGRHEGTARFPLRNHRVFREELVGGGLRIRIAFAVGIIRMVVVTIWRRIFHLFGTLSRKGFAGPSHCCITTVHVHSMVKKRGKIIERIPLLS